MLTFFKNLILLLTGLHLLQAHAIGQDNSGIITLSGKVEVIADSSNLFYSPPKSIENNPYALPGATVVVLDLDSTLVTGDVTNQTAGVFEIKGISPGEYILKTSYIGYEDRYDRLKISNNNSLFLELKLGHIYQTSDLPFHEAHAIDDLNNGIVIFKIWGEVIGGPHPLEDQQLQEKFSFNVVHVNKKFADIYEEQWEKLRQATIRYNIVVDDYLSKKYPKRWESLHGIW